MIDLPALLEDPRDDTLVYACGPEPLLRPAEQHTVHWPSQTLRLKRFAPKPVERTAPDTAFEVEFAGSGAVVEVGGEETILEADETMMICVSRAAGGARPGRD